MSDPTKFDSGNPVALGQQQNTIDAPDSGSIPGDSAVSSIGGTQPKPAIPAGTQPNRDPDAIPGTVELHHTMLASIFQDLAGGKKTTWRQTDDGPVPVKENLQPGEMARGILAAALTGLASGYTTRGGPGGNKAQAFTAGFEGEESRREKQATQAKTEAEGEFKNKNIADEMTLRKMQNARDQQRSIDEHQDSTLRQEKMAQDIAQGKVRDLHENEQYFIQQQNDWNQAMSVGMKPLEGSPEFSSNEELVKWLDKNAKNAIQPGKFNTVIKTDPYTGRFVILQKPKNWDDPQWMGVQVDSNGNPVRDKNGNMIANGDFKGSDGKPRVPAGQMTPHQLYDSQVRLLDLQNKELTRLEMLERLKNMRRERAKDEQLNKAEQEWNAAGGNPDAIDPKTGNFVMSPTSRNVVRQTFIKEASAEAGLLSSIEREMDKMGAPGPNASAEDKQQWQEMQKQAAEARGNLHQLQISMGLLGRVPNIADITAGNIRTQFTKDDGSYDEESALKTVDSITAPSAVKQQIRQRLSSEPLPRPIEQIETVAKQIAAMPENLRESTINGQTSLNKADKETLRAKVQAQVEVSKPVANRILDPIGKKISGVVGQAADRLLHGPEEVRDKSKQPSL